MSWRLRMMVTKAEAARAWERIGRWERRLFPLLAFAAAFVLGGVAVAWPGGGVGYPNTLIYDFWVGRTAPNTVTVGATGAETGIAKAGTGDLGIGPNSANSVMGLYAGSAGAARTKYAGVDLNGLTLANGASHVATPSGVDGFIDIATGQFGRLRINGSDALTWAGATPTVACPNGLSVGGGASLGKIGGMIDLGTQTSVSATTGDFQGFTFVALNGNATVDTCMWTVDTPGTGVGTCNAILRVAGASQCTVNYTCNAPAGTQATCTGGVIGNGLTGNLRVVSPASNTTAKGGLVCSYHY